MEKYLYLTKADWVYPWINGGRVPLRLASTYKREARGGIFTPDENLIYESTHDLDTLRPAIEAGPDARNFFVGKVIINGVTVAENLRASRYQDDGVILSLCNRKSGSIAAQLGKVACVKIHQVELLKQVIDQQLGVAGIAKDCEYTTSYERNHFLKPKDDEWQREFRIFWPLNQNVEVDLPRGLAKKIKI